MGERWTRPDRFRPDEVGEAGTAGERAEAMATARELEWLAATDDVAPGAGFADRVMAAVAVEPTPRPVTAAATAARRGAVLGVLVALGDVWRVAWSGGRPLAVRAPAIALVVFLVAGTLGAGVVGVGALGSLLDRPTESPVPTQLASPSPPLASPSVSPLSSATPSATPAPSPTASPSGEPSESPGAATPAVPTAIPGAAETPRPTRTPPPSEAPSPSEAPDEDDDESPKPSESPDDD
jgi:hypothetical protein